MSKKSTLGAAGALAGAILLAGSIYASPYWTVYQLRTAITERNAAAFSERVDYPALRESMKAQFTATLAQKMGTADMQANPFAALGGALALGLANQIVDAMVTPAGVMFMLDNADISVKAAAKRNETQAPANAPAGASSQTTEAPAEYALRYENWSTVKAHAKSQDAKADGAFIFKRDGLWSWKLAGIEVAPR